MSAADCNHAESRREISLTAAAFHKERDYKRISARTRIYMYILFNICMIPLRDRMNNQNGSKAATPTIDLLREGGKLLLLVLSFTLRSFPPPPLFGDFRIIETARGITVQSDAFG